MDSVNTEPCADRGPRRGSPDGVVDAPDATGSSDQVEQNRTGFALRCAVVAMPHRQRLPINLGLRPNPQ
jgi:hypothetical protein